MPYLAEQGYQLSCELTPPHTSDVKAVLALSDDRLATASRDQSVGIWKRSSDAKSYELQSLLGGHGAYVNSLAHIPAHEGNDEYIASGGNSSLILLHSLRTLCSESTHALIGHQLNVSTLYYSPKRRKLISGSWDRTARIWAPASEATDARVGEKEEGWETELVLEGHEEAVWGVLAIDAGPQSGGWLTASADRLIYLWSETGELLMRFKGSPEPVRGLCPLPDAAAGFVSACNDGMVRKWDWTGSVTGVLKGHTDYVYQVVTGSQGHLISCGEDHTARVWETDGEPATMLHPCQTVWSVTQSEDGDVITGGSDGRIRVWTKQEERFAALEVREAYAATVAEAMQNYKPNKADQADATAAAGIGAGGQVTIDIDIRYVFHTCADRDIVDQDDCDDAPPIPLTFDRGDDPRLTAFEFGKAHGLSDNYINQIEAFIRAHAS